MISWCICGRQSGTRFGSFPNFFDFALLFVILPNLPYSSVTASRGMPEPCPGRSFIPSSFFTLGPSTVTWKFGSPRIGIVMEPFPAPLASSLEGLGHNFGPGTQYEFEVQISQPRISVSAGINGERSIFVCIFVVCILHYRRSQNRGY